MGWRGEGEGFRCHCTTASAGVHIHAIFTNGCQLWTLCGGVQPLVEHLVSGNMSSTYYLLIY